MALPRTLRLHDESAQPSGWNERMFAGEYAVHPALDPMPVPACTVFPNLAEAEAAAHHALRAHPGLRYRIYDARGFVGEPAADLRGTGFKGESDLSPKVRRWLGGGFLLVGTALMLLDWSTDFTMTWPGVLGSRLLIPGLILLVTEGLILLNAKQKKGLRS